MDFSGGLELLLVVVVPLFLRLVGGDAVANSYIEDAQELSMPRFLATKANYQHSLGHKAVLECAVENLGDKMVSWRRVSTGQVLTVGETNFASNPKYEVDHPPGSSLWNLIIRDLLMTDAGVYECQISVRGHHLRRHVTLLVNEEVTTKTTPTSKIRITGEAYVDQGKRIFLTCNATAMEQPPEDLDWFREGNRLQTSDENGIYIHKSVSLSTSTIVSILEIKHARLEDRGVYVCRTSSLDVTSFRVDVLNGDKNVNSVKRGTDKDHTSDYGRHIGSSAPELRHRLLTSALFAAGAVIFFRHFLCHVT